MAGMLPGVECARRRRLHQSSDSPTAINHGLSRRSSFCLYRSHHENFHSSISYLKQRGMLNQAYQDEKLGEVAREAKERLDERLRAQRKSETRRYRSTTNVARGNVDGRSTMAVGELQAEVFGGKKISGSKMFNWAKLSWKSTDQDECTICLERFKTGETLLHLPCAHKFHAKCLVPWLENNAHCPCCRLEIHVQFS